MGVQVRAMVVAKLLHFKINASLYRAIYRMYGTRHSVCDTVYTTQRSGHSVHDTVYATQCTRHS
eukprot:7763573-Lingulodinium_polyedra.AAC.1